MRYDGIQWFEAVRDLDRRVEALELMRAADNPRMTATEVSELQKGKHLLKNRNIPEGTFASEVLRCSECKRPTGHPGLCQDCAGADPLCHSGSNGLESSSPEVTVPKSGMSSDDVDAFIKFARLVAAASIAPVYIDWKTVRTEATNLLDRLHKVQS